MVNRLLARDFPGCDFTEVLANPLNVCLVEGENGAIFAWRGPGIYEIHLFYEARGKEALRLFDSMLGIIHSAYGARLFWALIPLPDLHVRMFARLCGFAASGTFETRHGANELFVLGFAHLGTDEAEDRDGIEGIEDVVGESHIARKPAPTEISLSHSRLSHF